MSKTLNYEMAFTLAVAEATQSQLRARYYEQRIATGLYLEKLGTVKWGNGIDLTEAELLKDEVATMARHIQLAQDQLEHAKDCMAKAEEERAQKEHPPANQHDYGHSGYELRSRLIDTGLAADWWARQSRDLRMGVARRWSVALADITPEMKRAAWLDAGKPGGN